MSDQTVIGISALLGVIVTTIGGIQIAKYKNKNDSKNTGFTQSFEMSKYIREEIEKEVIKQTAPLKARLRAMEKVIGPLYDLRDAFREFYRDVVEKLGADTPHVEERIRSLFEGVDADTKTRQMMDDIRADVQQDETGL